MFLFRIVILNAVKDLALRQRTIVQDGSWECRRRPLTTRLDILQKNGNLLEEISKHQCHMFKHITKEVR